MLPRDSRGVNEVYLLARAWETPLLRFPVSGIIGCTLCLILRDPRLLLGVRSLLFFSGSHSAENAWEKGGNHWKKNSSVSEGPGNYVTS